MGNAVNRIISIIILTVSVIALCVSCVEYESKPGISTCLLSVNREGVALTCPQPGAQDCLWYSCTDDEMSNPVEVGSGASYETEVFTEPEMRRYYCTYTYGGAKQTSPVFHVAYTGLATVLIDTNDGKEVTRKTQYAGATIRIEASGATDSAFRNVKALEETDVLIKGRGASSWMSMPNKSYNLKFDEGKVSLLKGGAKSKRWCLTANYIDACEMGNWYASYVGNEIFNTVWEPDFEHVNLVLNGEFRGLYILGETVKIEKNRINIPDVSEIGELEIATDDHNGNGVIDLDDAGYVLEITSEANISSFSTLHGIGITFKDPDLEELEKDLCPYSRAQIVSHVQRKVNRLEAAIMGDSGEDFTQLMDLASMVDWFLANVIVCNNESGFKTSCYFYFDPASGKFFMGPNWDFDRGLVNRNPGTILTTGPANRWYRALVENPVFTSAVKARWAECLADGSIYDSIAAAYVTEQRISVALEMDNAKWGKEYSSVGEVKAWLESHISIITSYIEEL